MIGTRWRRRVRPAAGRAARHRRAAAGAFAAQLARPRLVCLLCRRCADRFRPLRLGIPHHPKMDADRYRPCSLRGRFRVPHCANAGRRAGRRGALRTAGRRDCDRRDLPQRAGLCRAADFPDGALGRHCAFAGKLRARPGHCGNQPRACGARGDQRTAGPQCPICLHRQRTRRRRDGRRSDIFHRAGFSSSPSVC